MANLWAVVPSGWLRSQQLEPRIKAGVRVPVPKPRLRTRVKGPHPSTKGQSQSQTSEPKVRTGLPGVRQGRGKADVKPGVGLGTRREQELLHHWQML